MELGKEFWDTRYKEGQTGWDIGHPSPPLVDYPERHLDQDVEILIPGCGNAYEAERLLDLGFKNITLLDISEQISIKVQDKLGDKCKVINTDFFHHQGQYDVILEQTFMCALNPNLRKDYAKKTSELLKENGRLIGVLFNINFDKQGPPFGGSKKEYEELFQPYYHIEIMEECRNSIPPRQGSELFINLLKK